MHAEVKKPSTPTLLRDRLREQTQSLILEAAQQLLGEEGLANARIDAIAARAGVSVGTLYNHFKDRDAILAAVLESNLQALLRSLDAVLADPSPDYATALRQFVSAFSDHWQQNGEVVHLLMTGQPDLTNLLCNRQDVIREIRWRGARLIKLGVDAGVLRSDHPSLFGDFLLALMRQRWMQRMMLPDEVLPDVHHMIEFFLHGAGRRPIAAASEIPLSRASDV